MKREVIVPEEYITMEVLLMNKITEYTLGALKEIGEEIKMEHQKLYSNIEHEMEDFKIEFKDDLIDGELIKCIVFKSGYYSSVIKMKDIFKQLLIEMNYDEGISINDGVLVEVLNTIGDAPEIRNKSFFKHIVYSII